MNIFFQAIVAVVDFNLFIVCTLSFFSVLFLSVLVVHYALDRSCTLLKAVL